MICLILVTGLASWLLTLVVIKLSERKKFYSFPNYRSLHDHPVPKGGGIAITITWYTGITILLLSGIIELDLYLALLSGIILAIVSLIDDMKGLRPVIRLVFHFITAIIALIILGGLRRFITPGFDFNYNFILYPLAVIGIVWFINLYNFMDGVDGFASLEALIISFVIFAYSGEAINLILFASISGFIFWNWPRARIFMGDVGSTQIGFILIVLGIYFHNSYSFSILNWIMLSSPFWFDATLTLYRRWKVGEDLSLAHNKHAYQRIVRAGFSHLKVNIWLIIINGLVVLMILVYREFNFLHVPVFVLTLFLLYTITRYIDKRMPFEKN
jgi:UDP-N-acetylmuramyl pentapeptide phosphotransferase/UDP-N-acetylglucosamine-1-phosphate transferase